MIGNNKNNGIPKVTVRLQNSHAENNLSFDNPSDQSLFPRLKKIPYELIKSLSRAELGVLDYLIRMRAYHPYVIVGHRRIAQIVKICRQHVVTVMRKLKSLGLINWYRDPLSWYKEFANAYMVNPLVDDLTFRAQCGKLLGGLRLLCASLLVSMNTLSKAAADRDTTSLFSNVFNLRTVPYTVNGLSIVNGTNRPSWINGARIRYKKVKQGYTKEERRMNTLESMEATKHLKSINLASRGRFELSAFPVAALLHADALMLAMKNPIKDRYAFFKSLCLKWCKENGVRADFSHVDEWKIRVPELSQMPFEEGKAIGGTAFKKTVGTKGTVVTRDPSNGSTVSIPAAPRVDVDIDSNKSQAVIAMQSAGEPISHKKQEFVDILSGSRRFENNVRPKLNDVTKRAATVSTVGELLAAVLPQAPTSPFAELMREYSDKLPTEQIDQTVRDACDGAFDDEQSPLIPPVSHEDELYEEILSEVIT